MQLLRDTEIELLHPLPLWERADLKEADLIAEFQREARVVRKAVSGDLTKVSDAPILCTSQGSAMPKGPFFKEHCQDLALKARHHSSLPFHSSGKIERPVCLNISNSESCD